MSFRGQAARRLLRARRTFWQFGQKNDGRVWDGQVACSTTELQVLIYLWTGRVYTLNYIALRCGYPYRGGGVKRGLTAAEWQRGAEFFELPYRMVFGRPWQELALATGTLGPIPFAMLYGDWPERRGQRYGGRLAVAPFARPLGDAGATQLTGFERGRHMALLLEVAPGGPDAYEAATHEPNRRSASRPHVPKQGYDLTTNREARASYLAFADSTGFGMAAIPTEPWDAAAALRREGLELPRSLTRDNVKLVELTRETLPVIGRDAPKHDPPPDVMNVPFEDAATE